MDADDPLRDSTRDLRRTLHLAESIDAAAADVAIALSSERDPQRALKAAIHLHLGRAFDAGAGNLAQLASALHVARAQIDRLRKINRELTKRISGDR